MSHEKLFKSVNGDLVEMPEEEATEIRAMWAANAPKQPTPDELIRAAIAAVQKALDDKAREYGYDNIVSACSYAVDPVNQTFKDEGLAFLCWRSKSWSRLIELENRIRSGQIPVPSVEEVVALMPEFEPPIPTGAV
jgi:hypothetical protein